MTKLIYIICVGPENVELHLAGLPHLTAHEVVLFRTDDCQKSKELQNKISELGMVAREVLVKDEYPDVYLKASKEISGLLGDDACIAINASTGSRIVTSAVEDATRVQLADFHSRGGYRAGPICSAFRYFVTSSKGKTIVRLAPIWNMSNPFHNVVMALMIERREYLSVREIWKILNELEEYPTSYESFRKLFRKFTNWIKNLPCFKQKIERGQRFILEL